MDTVYRETTVIAAPVLRATACTVISALLTTELRAQEPASAPESGTGKQEVVLVTANRRQENLQSVPIVVAAISGESATAFGITDMQSLANAVPGLTFEQLMADLDKDREDCR